MLITEQPSGTKNGSNVTFTLSQAPSANFQLFVNGLVQLSGVGFTRVTVTLTMARAPQSWEFLWAAYEGAATHVLVAGLNDSDTTTGDIVRTATMIAGLSEAETITANLVVITQFIVQVLPRTGVGPKYEVEAVSRCVIDPVMEVIDGVLQTPYEPAYRQNRGTYECSIKVRKSGTTRDLPVYGPISVNLSESSPMQWSIPMVHRGELHPVKAGTWHEWMDNQPYSSSTQISKEVFITGRYGGHDWGFIGIPTNWSSSRSGAAGNRVEQSWAGVDWSQRLFQQVNSMATIRSSLNGGIVSARSTIESICAARGVKCSTTSMTDYPIPVMHRQKGRPIEWIEEILSVIMGEWQVIGDVFHAYDPTVKENGAPDWTYNVTSLVEQETESAALDKIINRVTITRTIETNKNTQTFDVWDFQEYNVTFDPPVNSCTYRKIHEAEGIFTDIILKNSAGQVIAVREPRASYDESLITAVANEIALITYTWGIRPNFPGPILGSSGSISFTGHPGYPVDSLFGAMDHDLTVVVENAASIAKHGLQPIEMSANPLCPNRATMVLQGERYLARVGRQQREASLIVPFNPLMYPAQTVVETDTLLGLTRTRYITNVNHTLSPDETVRQTNYIAVEYLE